MTQSKTPKYDKAVAKTNKLRQQRRTATEKLTAAEAKLTATEEALFKKLEKLRQSNQKKLAPLRMKVENLKKAETEAALAAHKLGKDEGVSFGQRLADFRGATDDTNTETTSTNVNPTN